MTVDEVLERLEAFVNKHESQVAAAKAMHITASYLSDVRNRRRAPGPAILEALGIERAESYRRAK